MFDLKSFRISNKISQSKMAELLDSNQATVSKMESFIFEVSQENIDKLKKEFGKKVDDYIIDAPILSDTLKTFNWKEAGDEGFDEIKGQIISILQSIESHTGLTTDQVSGRLFKNKKTLHQFLSSERISPNIANLILKNHNKIINEFKSEEQTIPDDSNKIISGDGCVLDKENLLMFANKRLKDRGIFYLKPKELLATNSEASKFLLDFLTEANYYLLVDSNNLSPYIKRGDIIGISEIQKEQISAGGYYFLEFESGKYSYDYLQIGAKPSSWGLCSSKDNQAYLEMKESQFKRIFKIILTIRRED